MRRKTKKHSRKIKNNETVAGYKKRLFSKKAIFLIVFLAAFILFLSIILVQGFILPKIEVGKAYKPNAITYVYSDDNALIGHICLEKRVFVPIGKIPKTLQEAFISAEDRNFYDHSGIDVGGIIRAGIKNLLAGRIVQGGSTITQQVARWMFLSKERTITRKLKEAILAVRLENKLTKKQILELYLNQIYFGHGAYGVEIAARDYFNKSVNKLTLGESALLAGLPKAPNTYSPLRNPVLSKKRRNYVLERMYEDKKITKAKQESAKKEKITLNLFLKDMEASPYFLNLVEKELQEKYANEKQYNQEIKVYTTLNRRMQRIAIHSLKEGLRELDKRQIDPKRKTSFRGVLRHINLDEIESLEDFDWGFNIAESPSIGAITAGVVEGIDDEKVTLKIQRFKGVMKKKAMRWAFTEKGPQKPSDIFKIGDVVKARVLKVKQNNLLEVGLEQDPIVQGAIVAIEPKTGEIKALVGGYDFDRSQYNRAISAKREPGSAFKPIIYFTALQNGFTPASIIIDSPVIFGNEKNDSIWKPENFGNKFYGPTLLRDALIQSRNVCTVKLLKEVGVPKVMENARLLGIKSNLERNLSLALGTSSVSLFELTSAYSVFANLGEKTEPASIKFIRRSAGEKIHSRAEQIKRVFDDKTTFILVKILEGVVQEGTGGAAKVLGLPVAGKTGTTNNYMDAWFIGFTKDLVVGVWVGYDDKKSLGSGETGARAALPIWIKFMSEALKEYYVDDFPQPEGVVETLIDPKTGNLASADTETPITEYFIEGTQPGEKSNKDAVDSSKFFQLGE